MTFHPPIPLRANLKSEWGLDGRIAFLNHGSFGATPRCVMKEQSEWRGRIEAEPVEMLARRGPELLTDVRRAVGRWLGMAERDFGLVTNATEGINAVLRSLELRTGDELLTTNHVYNAVRQAMKYAAGRAGAEYREVKVPLPVQSPEQIAGLVCEAISPRTRLLVVDHVTSPTALIFPVDEIARECSRRGVDLLVDGAHAPGMLPLDVSGIGAAYYAGNLHKWVCGPKGSGFLWVRPDRQADVHPLIISHHLAEGFAAEFGWQGTRDISGWLAIPRALRFMSELGWERVREHNHQMAVWARAILCERWRVDPISPLDGRMVGSMVTVALPGPLHQSTMSQVQELQSRLYRELQIEVPVMRWEEHAFVRPCCQIYNIAPDYERLAGAILAHFGQV